jgi:hypothetical protein
MTLKRRLTKLEQHIGADTPHIFRLCVAYEDSLTGERDVAAWYEMTRRSSRKAGRNTQSARMVWGKEGDGAPPANAEKFTVSVSLTPFVTVNFPMVSGQHSPCPDISDGLFLTKFCMLRLARKKSFSGKFVAQSHGGIGWWTAYRCLAHTSFSGKFTSQMASDGSTP